MRSRPAQIAELSIISPRLRTSTSEAPHKPHASTRWFWQSGIGITTPSVKKAEEVSRRGYTPEGNPNVVVFGAYFTQTFSDSAPHMHVVMLSVKTSEVWTYKLAKRCSNEQGYFLEKEDGKFITPQTQLQRDSRVLLRSISQERVSGRRSVAGTENKEQRSWYRAL